MCCFPEKVDISISAKLGNKKNQNFSRKCQCIKCEKYSVDGSCYCSHCLGIFDKSVGIKPFNKEIATQCLCQPFNEEIVTQCPSHNANNMDVTKDMSNKTDSSETDTFLIDNVNDENNFSNTSISNTQQNSSTFKPQTKQV